MLPLGLIPRKGRVHSALPIIRSRSAPPAYQNKTRAPAVERKIQDGHGVRDSDQALLQHTGHSTYGCFLSDLTEFSGIPLSRTQPSAPLPRTS